MLSPLFLRFPPLFALLPNQTRVDSFILDFPAAVSLQYHGTNLSTTAAAGWERRNAAAAAAPELKSPRAKMSLFIYKGKWGKMAEKNYILCTGNRGCLWVRMFLASLAPLEIGYRSLPLSRSSSSGVGREEKKRNWCRKEEVGYRRVWLLLLLLLFPPFALGGYRDGRGKGIENKFRKTSKRLTISRYVCLKRSVFLDKVF